MPVYAGFFADFKFRNVQVVLLLEMPRSQQLWRLLKLPGQFRWHTAAKLMPVLFRHESGSG